MDDEEKDIEWGIVNKVRWKPLEQWGYFKLDTEDDRQPWRFEKEKNVVETEQGRLF